MRKQIVKSGIFIVIVKIIGTILSFILSVLLARILGTEGYGVYSFALSLLMLLSIPIQSGIPILAVREISRLLVVKEYSLIGIFLTLCKKIIFIYSFVLAVLLLLIVLFLEDWDGSSRFQVFLVGFLSIPLMSLILMNSAAVRGLGRIVLGIICDGFFRPMINMILVLFLMLFFLDEKITALNAISVYTVSIFITFVISFFLFKWSVKSYSIFSGVYRKVPSRWKGSLCSLTVVGGAQVLFGYLDVLILSFFCSDSEIGIYRVTVQLSLLASFALMILNQMLQPYFSRLHKSERFNELQKLAANSSLIIFVSAVIPAICFIFIGGTILSVIYGEEYLFGFFALKMLVLGQLINAAFGSVGALLNMTGYEKDSVKGMLIAVAVNVFFNFMLIPWFGINGAAISSALSFFVWNGVLRLYVKKRLNIESSGVLYYLKKIIIFYRVEK